ncbi:unnamed protein product [Malus baccata var. baccata]
MATEHLVQYHGFWLNLALALKVVLLLQHHSNFLKASAPTASTCVATYGSYIPHI